MQQERKANFLHASTTLVCDQWPWSWSQVDHPETSHMAQIVLPMRAALQVTKRVAADVSWAYILHNNCRHTSKIYDSPVSYSKNKKAAWCQKLDCAMVRLSTDAKGSTDATTLVCRLHSLHMQIAKKEITCIGYQQPEICNQAEP